MKLKYTIVSETGLRRSNNEDAVHFHSPDKPWIEKSMGKLAVVSDGMGGYERGEKASAMVVETLLETYYKGVGSPGETLRKAAVEANNAIAREAIASRQRMGATCTATVFLEDKLYFLHIGDSRCYTFQNGALKLITTDHTAANDMARFADLRHSAETLLFNPHALTKAMGMEVSETSQADVFSIDNTLQKGDRVLLCSDGLYLHFPDGELQEILRERKPLKDTSDKLVKLVMQRGAKDNFSFILVEYG